MGHDGSSVAFDVVRTRYRRSLQSCCMVFRSTVTLRLCYDSFGDFSSTVNTGDERMRRMSYMSVVLETKSVRARCIRVAAIDIVITDGS